MAKLKIEQYIKQATGNRDKETVSTEFATLFASELDNFKKQLNQLEATGDGSNESQIRSYVTNFLEKLYQLESGRLFVEKDRIDLAILSEPGSKDIEILIETKSLSSSEMPTPKKLEVKGLYQIMLYYLEYDRDPTTNDTLKHLIITNGYEWLVFDNRTFYHALKENKPLQKKFKEWKIGKTGGGNKNYFYEHIAPVLTNPDELDFCYFNLNEPYVNHAKTLALLFSPQVFFKKESYINANALNTKFYFELLYIMGVKEATKKAIEKESQGVATDAEKESNELVFIVDAHIQNSLLDLTKKEVTDNFERFKEDNKRPISEFGASKEEQIFSISFELVMTWINRLLFLKLLEGRLISFFYDEQNDNVANKHKLLELDEKNTQIFRKFAELFFKVFNVDYDQRDSALETKMRLMPYLNSSLFEPTPLEQHVSIKDLNDSPLMKLKPKGHDSAPATVLWGKKENTKLTHLRPSVYLLRFLAAYDFSTKGDGSAISYKESVINASVLGNIFEKLNGYKDGSFYTPSYITSYICKHTIEQAVVAKVNALPFIKNKVTSYADVRARFREWTGDHDTARLTAIRTAIKEITVIDPAVGSGHFLVSALNEIMRIWFEFKLLPITWEYYTVKVEADELMVRSHTMDRHTGIRKRFTYDPLRDDDNSLGVQKELFAAKQAIIENNLFGVDINPKSVAICRLRLWIELLKSTYYVHYAAADDAYSTLQVLPNIDINIKEGNSLVSALPLRDDKKLNKNELAQVRRYAKVVAAYKHATVDKKEVIAELKNAHDELQTSLRKQLDLAFKAGEDLAKKAKEDAKLLAKHDDTFEWRMEFPEALDKEGKFLGFDAVVGNPPYIQLQSMAKPVKEILSAMNYFTYTSRGDIYALFYELGFKLLKPEAGVLGFITSNKWMRTEYGVTLREFLTRNTHPLQLIDFNDAQLFHRAAVMVNILIGVNYPTTIKALGCDLSGLKPKRDEEIDLPAVMEQYGLKRLYPHANNFLIMAPAQAELKAQVESLGTPLEEWGLTIVRGILTGLNEAFYIDDATRAALIAEDPKSAELIVPQLRGRDLTAYTSKPNAWLINTHNGVISAGIAPVDVQAYPAIKKHLDNWLPKLAKRTDKGSTPYNLRHCAYLANFAQPKLIYPNMSKFMPFCYDESGVFVNQKGFIVTQPDGGGEVLKYLTGLMNSHLWFYMWEFYFPKLMGDTFEPSKIYMEKIPVLKPTPEQQAQVVGLVDRIIAAKAAEGNYYNMVEELNDVVFNLYGLTAEQRFMVRNSVSHPEFGLQG